jgi:hypothetical protein
VIGGLFDPDVDAIFARSGQALDYVEKIWARSDQREPGSKTRLSYQKLGHLPIIIEQYPLKAVQHRFGDVVDVDRRFALIKVDVRTARSWSGDAASCVSRTRAACDTRSRHRRRERGLALALRGAPATMNSIPVHRAGGPARQASA